MIIESGQDPELAANGAALVLTLSANVLAIIGSCSPTDDCAHNRCQ
jgi:hypothetical protein